jgi:hypothetical protein
MVMRKRKTQAEILVAKAVDQAVGRALSGRPIPIMAISKVYDRAWALVSNGHTAEHLEAHLVSYVQSLEVKVSP